MNRTSFTLRPEFAEVDRARGAIEGWLASTCAGNTMDDARIEFLIAAVEAMNNAVEHSGAPEIAVEFETSSDGTVSLTIITFGERFDPTANIALMPEFESNDTDDLPEGGFGLAIISQMVDAVEYRYEDGKNHLTLRKRLNKGENNA